MAIKTPQNNSDEVLQCVRDSDLHFVINETPFSVYITLRKRFVKGNTQKHTDQAISEAEILKVQLQSTIQKNEYLVEKIKQLEDLVEEKLCEIKNRDDLVHELVANLDEAKSELSISLKHAKDLTKLKEDFLQTVNSVTKKQKDVAEDLKQSKIETENIKVELQQANKAYKVKEKELYKLATKVDNLETVVKNLKAENKDLASDKAKISKENLRIQKQLQKIRERKPSETKSTTTTPVYFAEAFTSTATRTTSVGSSNTPKVIKSSQISQTDGHPDIPYDIKTPLPPIFNSNLVHQTKPMKLLSRSHPDLARIHWREYTDHELIEDEIHEMEMDLYDAEIKEFYRDAAAKAKALREVYEENLIEKLFVEEEV